MCLIRCSHLRGDRVGLFLGETALVNGIGKPGLALLHHGLDHLGDRDPLSLGECRDGLSVAQRRTQLLRRQAHCGGRSVQTGAASRTICFSVTGTAEASLARASLGQSVVKSVGNSVGLVLRDRAVVNQAGEGQL